MTWLFANGTVEMACLQAKKKHQLVINVFQASILSLFNVNDELTCRQIIEATRMPMDLFKAAMMQMCNPKVKLLLKQVPKPTFGDDEMIKPNPNFSQNAIRVTLLPPKKKHKKETTEMTEEERNQ